MEWKGELKVSGTFTRAQRFQTIPAGNGFPWWMTTWSNCFPGGKVGLYSNLAGVKFDSPQVRMPVPAADLLGRWESQFSSIITGGNQLQLLQDGITNTFPVLLKNLRLQKWQATWSMTGDISTAPIASGWAFNAGDVNNLDYFMLSMSSSSSTGYQIFSLSNGAATSYDYGSMSSPAATNGQVMWNRLEFDGTTLKAWQIVKNSGAAAPTDSDWSAIHASPAYSSSAHIRSNSGGRMGFMPPHGGNPVANVGNLTVRSYDTSTSGN